MPLCFSCGEELKLSQPVGRRETCPQCGSDLRCCRNCRFYDPHVSNECHESQAERVLDKEGANFCDFFDFAKKPYSLKDRDEAAEAKRRLEVLFKKRSTS